MKELMIVVDNRLTVEELNLLSIAYKWIIRPLRTSWLSYCSYEKKEEKKNNTKLVSSIRKFKKQVEC